MTEETVTHMFEGTKAIDSVMQVKESKLSLRETTGRTAWRAVPVDFRPDLGPWAEDLGGYLEFGTRVAAARLTMEKSVAGGARICSISRPSPLRRSAGLDS